MKLINQTMMVGEKCKICQRLEVKMRRRQDEIMRLKRWQGESGREYSIMKARETIYELDKSIHELEMERRERYEMRC